MSGQCPQCKTGVLADDAFCGACGAALMPPVVGLRCSQCSALLVMQDAYCASCGHAVIRQGDSSSQQPTMSVSPPVSCIPLNVPRATPSAHPSATLPSPPHPIAAPISRPARSKTPSLLVTGFVTIGGLALFGTWFKTGRASQPLPTAAPQPSTTGAPAYNAPVFSAQIGRDRMPPQADQDTLLCYRAEGVGDEQTNRYFQNVTRAGVSASDANRLLRLAADCAAQSACQLDTVVQVLLTFLLYHPGQAREAAGILKTCSHYSSQYRAYYIFDSALNVASGRADAGQASETIVLAVFGGDRRPCTDLIRAFYKLAPPAKQ